MNIGSLSVPESTITNTGGVVTKVWPGDYVSKFSGSNYLQIPYHSGLNTNSFTVSCWVRSTTLGANWKAILVSRSSGDGYELYTKAATGKFYFGSGTGGTFTGIESTTSVSLNEWTHIVCVNDTSHSTQKQRIYVDGTLETTGNLNISVNESATLNIGVHENNSSYKFEGCLLYTSPSPRDLSTSRMPSSA